MRNIYLSISYTSRNQRLNEVNGKDYHFVNKSDFIFGTRYEKDCGSDDDTFVTFTGNYIFTFMGKIFAK